MKTPDKNINREPSFDEHGGNQPRADKSRECYNNDSDSDNQSQDYLRLSNTASNKNSSRQSESKSDGDDQRMVSLDDDDDAIQYNSQAMAAEFEIIQTEQCEIFNEIQRANSKWREIIETARTQCGKFKKLREKIRSDAVLRRKAKKENERMAKQLSKMSRIIESNRKTMKKLTGDQPQQTSFKIH